MAIDTAPLQRFIPHPDVRERFETTIRAPSTLVMDVAGEFDMQSLPAVKLIFRLRERLTRANHAAPRKPQGILEETRSLGWGLLAEQPGRFVVCGAACQPWLANVVFAAVAPDEFVAYAQPDQVKIAWTLEAVECSRSMASVAICMAVSYPNDTSVPSTSLSIVFGRFITFTPPCS